MTSRGSVFEGSSKYPRAILRSQDSYRVNYDKLFKHVYKDPYLPNKKFQKHQPQQKHTYLKQHPGETRRGNGRKSIHFLDPPRSPPKHLHVACSSANSRVKKLRGSGLDDETRRFLVQQGWGPQKRLRSL